MNDSFKFCLIAIGAMLSGTPAQAQCALCSDSNSNTSAGTSAVINTSTTSGNTAMGANALHATTGANNTALGLSALYSNSTGKGNAAQGVNALYSNTTGIRNIGIGSNALYENIAGSYNLALGFDAGYQTTGNDNIYLNNQGVVGESQILRLGTQGSSGAVGSGIITAYIAGVATSQVTGSAVYITQSGQLGVLASSERFKTDVETMHDASDKLAQLRPVTFKLKTDPRGTIQYGLIAEEVAKIYPDLVIHGADGRIDGLRYEELSPLLLSVVQQQQLKLAEQDQRNTEQAAQIRDLQHQLADLRDLKRQVAELRELASPAKAEKVKARVRSTT